MNDRLEDLLNGLAGRWHPLDRVMELTATDLIVVIGVVLLALNVRSEREPVIRLGLLTNRVLLFWGAAAVTVAVLTTQVSPLRIVFKTVPLDGRAWVLILVAATVGTCWLEVRKWLAWRWTVAGRRG